MTFDQFPLDEGIPPVGPDGRRPDPHAPKRTLAPLWITLVFIAVVGLLVPAAAWRAAWIRGARIEEDRFARNLSVGAAYALCTTAPDYEVIIWHTVSHDGFNDSTIQQSRLHGGMTGNRPAGATGPPPALTWRISKLVALVNDVPFDFEKGRVFLVSRPPSGLEVVTQLAIELPQPWPPTYEQLDTMAKTIVPIKDLAYPKLSAMRLQQPGAAAP